VEHSAFNHILHISRLSKVLPVYVISTSCGCHNVLVEREWYEDNDNKKIDQCRDGAQSFWSAIVVVSKADRVSEEVWTWTVHLRLLQL